MTLLNDILEQPVKLIENYINQNKTFSQEDPTSLYEKCTKNLHWLFGKNLELTAKKVRLAEEFLELFKASFANNYDAAKIPTTLNTTLQIIKEKIELAINMARTERISHQTEPGSYDASLTVFARLIDYMLERVKPLEFALIAEQVRPESDITAILLFLEKTLFAVMFDVFTHEQGSLLTTPRYFSTEHAEYIAKKLQDTIPTLHAIKISNKIDKTEMLPQDTIIAHQRILLQNIISGLMFDFQNKTSVGVNIIMTELSKLKLSLEEEQNKFEQQQQHSKMHSSKLFT